MHALNDAFRSREGGLIQAARIQEFGSATATTTSYNEHPPASHRRNTDLPPDMLGGYFIIREFHRGGQGVVYEAEQKGTHRRVAIKMLREGPFAGSRDRARFEREVRILGQLRHPNIVTIHHSGRSQGNIFFVMDFISGETLDTHLANQEWSVAQILTLFKKISDAVHAAHQKGIIHRDLKPSNIRIDSCGEPQILDFGLAKLIDSDLSQSLEVTQSGTFMGSLPWASPEQADGRSGLVDVRSDVYSMGVILFQILTGEFPYRVTGSVRDVLTHILESEPSHPSAHRKHLDDDVDAIVLKCLAKEPERRHQSALALSEDIERYLSHEPVLARTPSTIYRLKKLVKRNKMPAALVAALFVSISVFAVGMAVLYAQATTQRIQMAESEEHARAVNDFLINDMLSATENEIARGQQIGVAEILDSAADRVGVALQRQPLVQAAVRVAIGRSYLSLGMYQRAEEQLHAANELRSNLLGDDVRETLAVRVLLVDVMQRQNKLADAEPLCIDTYEACVRTLGEEHELTLASAVHRAWFYWYAGEVDLSRTLYDNTLATARRVLGDEHDRTISLMNAWSQWARWTTEAGEAEALYREALQAARKNLGENHPRTIEAMANLGYTLTNKRRFKEAEALLTRALELNRRILGDHPVTVHSMFQLSVLLTEAARLDETETLLREAMKMSTTVHGAEHSTTQHIRQKLAKTLTRQGDLQQAEVLARALLDFRRKAYGEDDQRTAASRHRLDLVLLQAGRYREAEELARLAYAHSTTSYSKNDRLKAEHIRSLVQALAAQGKLNEARPLGEEMLRLRQKVAEDSNASAYSFNCYAWDLLHVQPVDLRDPQRALDAALRAYDLSTDEYHYNRFTLGLAYLAKGQRSEALNMIRRALAKVPVEVSEDRHNYEAALAGIYEESGDEKEAEQVYRDTLRARREFFPGYHPDIAASLEDLAVTLMRHQNHAEAERFLRECQKIRETALPAGHWCIAHTISLLGASLAGQGRYGEAEKLLLDGYQRLSSNPDARRSVVRNSVTRAVDFYVAWGKPNRASVYSELLSSIE